MQNEEKEGILQNRLFQRGFKGIWTPSSVYLNKQLNWTDKVLLMEIDSLNNEDGCYASNKYFSEFLGISETSISKSISKLKNLGYVEQVSFNGRTRILKTRLEVNLKADLNKTSKQTETKLQGSIYSINNTKNKDNNKLLDANASETLLFSEEKFKKKNNHQSTIKNQIFGIGIELITESSKKSEKQVRTIIGKWLKDYQEAFVLSAIIEAKTRDIFDPIAWIEKYLEYTKKKASGFNNEFKSTMPERLYPDLKTIGEKVKWDKDGKPIIDDEVMARLTDEEKAILKKYEEKERE